MLSINKLFEGVQIEAENPGLLEVPEGTDIQNLSTNHFKKLIDKKGWDAISKGLVNLEVWNKNKNPGLSSWAKTMQHKLSKWWESHN